MSVKYGKGRLPSVKDKYEAAVEAEALAKAKEAEKVEEKPKRNKKNA